MLELNNRNNLEAKVNNEESLACEIDENEVQRRRQDTLLYLARLLHDDDFQAFVQNVEDSLTSTEDGAKLLAAFQVRDAFCARR